MGQIEPGDVDLFVAAIKRATAAGKDNRSRSASSTSKAQGSAGTIGRADFSGLHSRKHK
jgi:hypothetical protein